MPASMPQVSKQLVSDWTVDWTALDYAQLVENLGGLTRLGVFEEGSLASALAVARLIDRGRILRSGLRAAELRQMLDRYRQATDWRPIPAIERALEQAIAVVKVEQALSLRTGASAPATEAEAEASVAG